MAVNFLSPLHHENRPYNPSLKSSTPFPRRWIMTNQRGNVLQICTFLWLHSFIHFIFSDSIYIVFNFDWIYTYFHRYFKWYTVRKCNCHFKPHDVDMRWPKRILERSGYSVEAPMCRERAWQVLGRWKQRNGTGATLEGVKEFWLW